jgi:hypothetical protein
MPRKKVEKSGTTEKTNEAKIRDIIGTYEIPDLKTMLLEYREGNEESNIEKLAQIYKNEGFDNIEITFFGIAHPANQIIFYKPSYFQGKLIGSYAITFYEQEYKLTRVNSPLVPKAIRMLQAYVPDFRDTIAFALNFFDHKKIKVKIATAEDHKRYNANAKRRIFSGRKRRG